jgi:hypothetical protein
MARRARVEIDGDAMLPTSIGLIVVSWKRDWLVDVVDDVIGDESSKVGGGACGSTPAISQRKLRRHTFNFNPSTSPT